MAARRVAKAAFILLLGVAACSKTQDTAPERRIFGSPPTISAVSVSEVQDTATCDLAQTLQGVLCDGGYSPTQYTLTSPTLTFNIEYSDLTFAVTATDPDDTPSMSDILLTSASYTTKESSSANPQETTLVLFDDGSQTDFPYGIQKGEFGEKCADNPASTCGPDGITCTYDSFSMTSNDMTAGDHIFGRKFAFVEGNFPTRALGFIQDCIVSTKHQAPALAGSGVLGGPLEFKIEVTDRSGNIATWPTKPAVTISPSNFSCTGDECGCCFLSTANTCALPEDGGCKGLDGVVGVPGSGFEAGLCKTICGP